MQWQEVNTHFLPVITPLEKISICNAPSSNPTGAMGDRAHFSRPYMESGYDDDEGGKRKKKIRMMMSGSRPLQNAAGRAQMSRVSSRRGSHIFTFSTQEKASTYFAVLLKWLEKKFLRNP